MREINEIAKDTGMSDHACSCTKCQQMCHKAPCLGTPQDILNLINNGYQDKLKLSYWGSGLEHGVPVIPMVQATFNKGEGCIFLKDNLCTLHHLGLKPTEGRLASCKPKVISDFKHSLNYQVAATWKDGANYSVIKKILKVIS